jgi:ankyrin repeat protein
VNLIASQNYSYFNANSDSSQKLLYKTEYLTYSDFAMKRAVFPLLLLLAGCAPPSAWNMPPVIGAARSGDLANLEKLLENGADANVRAGVNGWTPLLHAIHKNQEGSVRALLKHGADPNGRGEAGATPLVMAAGYGYANIVKVLLDNGADPRLKAGDGRDPLTAAVGGVADIDRFTVGRCQSDTVRVLLDASPGLANRPVPATVARFAGCSEVLRLLQQRAPQER